MGRILHTITFSWLFSLIFLNSAIAQESDKAHSDRSDVVPLGAVVVTGTRTEKPILESPVRTEVVTRKEIEITHARNLKEALEDVPGLMLKSIHGKTGFEVWLQGFDGNRVLVVLDGEPITPSTGSTVDLTQIGTADIERIEIVKGATSALYGSNAMGGIINVITRKPDRPLEYNLIIDGGSYGDKNVSGNGSDIASHTIAGNLAIKRKLGYIQLTASMRDSDGYRLDPAVFKAEGSAGEKSNVDLRLAYTPNDDTEFFILPRYYDESVSNNVSTFAPGVGEIKGIRNEDAQRVRTTLGAIHGLKNGGRVRGWLLQDNWQSITQRDTLATPELEHQRTAEIQLYRGELQWDQPWGENHIFTSGIVLGQSALDQNKDTPNRRVIEVAGEEQRSIEAYLQDDIFIGEHWEIVPGIRVQEDSGFGFYAAPKINVMYTPHWFSDVITNVRMGYGRGYRVPNLKERFFVFDQSHHGYKVLGNEELQPESTDSYQLGLEFARPGEFQLDFTLFHNRSKDFILTQIDVNESALTGLNVYTYQNFSNTLIKGGEVSSRFRVQRFELRGSYTYLDSEDLDTGKTLKERPRHLLKLGSDWHHKAWGTMLTLRGTYQSKEHFDNDNTLQSPAWTTWDLKMTQAVSKGIKVFVGVDNLTDEYRDPHSRSDNRPLEGRFVYLGVRLEG